MTCTDILIQLKNVKKVSKSRFLQEKTAFVSDFCCVFYKYCEKPRNVEQKHEMFHVCL